MTDKNALEANIYDTYVFLLDRVNYFIGFPYNTYAI
jgi:hypothetical protein